MNLIQEQILRSALFVPCDTKEDLHRWIKIYLGLDLPNSIVCDTELHHEPSNSSPMDLVWEVYSKARQGVDPKFQELLAYAARESGKTLSASIIEILCLIHLERDVVHLAAIEPQAKYCLDYIRKFLSRPILKEFITSINRRNLKISKYKHGDGSIISPVQWAKLDPNAKSEYDEHKNEIIITVATVEACNGLHSPFMCVTGDSKVTLELYGAISVEDVVADLVGGKDRLVGTFETDKLAKDYKLLSFNTETEAYEFKPVTKVFRREANVIELQFEMASRGKLKETKTFTTIRCTPDHPVYCKPLPGQKAKGHWVPASELKPGFEVFSIFENCKVVSVGKKETQAPVYDFTIEGNHNFVCENVVIHNCMDELDLVDPAAFMEAKSIPTNTSDRKYPITFMTSTRKYSYGLVQKEIDRKDTHDTNLNIRHWNLIDITESCPPSRHLPEEPKIDIWVSENSLKAVSEEEFNKLPDKEKTDYEKHEGYKGCLQNCKIFSSCKGRLVDKQKSTSPMLKLIDHTQSNLTKVSLEHAKAQYLCWKPSSAGLVFPHFSRERHEISAQQMAIYATGEDPGINFTKKDLIALFKSLDATFYSGVDWGFTHNFVVVTAALLGHILYVIDVTVGGELLLPEKIELCTKRLKYLSPTMFPDSSYPADIRSFRQAGFKMVDFHKDVLEGISAVSERLYSQHERNPTIWFLKNDPGVAFLLREISLYHWKLDKAGNLLDEPEKIDDDSVDALKYLCQNLQLGKSTYVKVAKEREDKRNAPVPTKLQNFVATKIKELTQDNLDEEPSLKGDAGFKFII